MARPSFFNDNLNRSYPFKEGSVGINTPASGIFILSALPTNVIVDCGFIMGPESNFDESIDEVFLYRITRVNASIFEFEFRCTASNLLDAPLIFTRAINPDLFETEFVESKTADEINDSLSESFPVSSSIPAEECSEPLWTGFMVSGDMQSLASRIGVGISVIRLDTETAIVEPGLIQNLDQSQVVSINIANGDRTRALRPENCPANTWSFETGQIYVYATCLTGDVKFKPGFNLSITQDAAGNNLVFIPTVGAGEGQPCAEIPLFEGETPPENATNDLLAGDFYCNEALRSINGLPGPTLTLFGEAGVSILSDTVNHKLIVDINMTDLSVCDFSFSSISL